MILTSTSDLIKVTTSSTADLHVQAGWTDITTTAFTPGRTNTIITSATTTTVVASPGASTQRQVKTLRLYNAHASTSNTITAIHYDGTSNNTVYKHILLAGESIGYDGTKWELYDALGTLMYTTALPATMTSAQLAAALTDETGSGAAVFANTPTFVTPLLGTPNSGVLTNCTGLPPEGLTGQKAIIQQVFTTTGAMATGTTTMPLDNTTPQNTEGDEYMSLAITPTNASNILIIEALGYFTNSLTEGTQAALFQDSTADALKSCFTYLAVGACGPQQIVHRMVAGTTSATTFKFRVGRQTAATITFNGYLGVAYLNSTFTSYMRITELQV